MPQATATVNGIEVARSDTWEVVDGNIYVRFALSHPTTPYLLIQSTNEYMHIARLTPPVPPLLHQKIPLHTHFHLNPLPVQRRRELLHRDHK